MFKWNFMEKETNLAILPILFGIILAIGLSIVIWTFNSAFAKSENLQYEILDCTVQRNSTYEKSGSCTDTGVETKVDKLVETKPIDSTEHEVSELIDPFGPIT